MLKGGGEGRGGLDQCLHFFFGGGRGVKNGRFYADIIYDSSRKCATLDPTDDSYLLQCSRFYYIVKFAAALTAGFSKYFANISSIN